MVGRKDGTAVAYVGLEPDRLRVRDPDAIHLESLLLLGAAHRSCVGEPDDEIGIRRFPSPKDPVPLVVDDLDELPEQFHRPPAGPYCPFCGGSEQLTIEHVWPRWVSETLREMPGLKNRDRPFVLRGNRARRKVRSIDISARICHLCNNRWLATLEQRAQRSLAPMVRGEAAALDQTEQMLAATWAAKTALMLDLSSPGGPIIPLGYFRDFAWRRAPQDSMRVFIAGYKGPKAAIGIRKVLAAEPREGKPHAVGITWCAGAFVFQLFMHLVVSADFRDDRAQFANSAVQIWPSVRRSVTWPPGGTFLDHSALILLSDSLSVSYPGSSVISS